VGRTAELEVVAKVGEGGMCEVFRAVSPRGGPTLALKVLRPELALDPRETQRFLNESRTGQRLSHANILPVLDTCSRRRARDYESCEPFRAVFHDKAGRLWNRSAAESSDCRGSRWIAGANESERRQRCRGFAAVAALGQRGSKL
jgi:hypothetical protein